MALTPAIKLPILVENQERAEVTVNEAFWLLDALVQGNVTNSRATTPPVGPADGVRFLIPPSATGAWTGQSGKVAVYRSGAWIFISPVEGWTFWDRNWNTYVRFDGAAWRRTIRFPTNNAATNPRPSSPLSGEAVFDLNIGLPIWWNGTDWINAAGVIV